MAGSEQQDAHEFCMSLLDVLHVASVHENTLCQSSTSSTLLNTKLKSRVKLEPVDQPLSSNVCIYDKGECIGSEPDCNCIV